MSREYDEKRDFIRVEVDSKMNYGPGGQQMSEGRIKNLSGRGMMFIADAEVPVESILEVKIHPENDITPPLHANVRVVRVMKQKRGPGFEVGAVIQEMLDD